MKTINQNKDSEFCVLYLNIKAVNFNGLGTIKISNKDIKARKTLIEFMQYINNVYSLKCSYQTTLLNTVFNFESISEYLNICETSDFKRTIVEFYYSVYVAENFELGKAF